MATTSTPAVQTTVTNQFIGSDVRIASATGTLGFFGATPVAKTTSAGNATGFVANAGTAANSLSVWAGATGSTAYTVGDIVTILKAYGLLTL